MSIREDFDIFEKFQMPSTYWPPEDYADQVICTEYPNRNSTQYRQKPVKPETKIWPSYQCLVRNSKGRIILGSNTYLDRIWCGSLYAFDNINEDIPKLVAENNTFHICTDASVSVLEYIDDMLFILGETDGQMTLFNSKSMMNEADKHNYCPFIVGKKKEHKALVSCLDIFKHERQKAITGDTDGCLITWDVANADLTSIHNIRFAHSDAINGVATTLTNDYTFVTASDDKSLLYWDMRDTRPCSALLENHAFQLKAVEYVNENQILVGDKEGIVYLIDVKMPKQIMMQRMIHNRPIHKFFLNGKNVIILTDSNRLNVCQITDTKMNSVLDVEDAPNYLRSAAWIDDTEFYVAGWSSTIKKYKI